MKKILITLLPFVIVCAVTFGCVELISSFWISHRSDALQRAKVILRMDPQLGWRQKPDLVTEFENSPVVTDAGGFRQNPSLPAQLKDSEVLVLGPSSAFGWGVNYSETYAGRLPELTGLKVFNASQIGYTVAQGERLWEQLKSGSEKLQYVVLSYGVNEVDRFRFFGVNGVSDDAFFSLPESARFHALEKYNISLSFWALFLRAFSEGQTLWSCPSVTSPDLRVQPEFFEKKMNALAEKITAAGGRPVIVSSALLFLNQPQDPSLMNKSDELYGRSATEAGQGNCREAARLYREAHQYEQFRIKRDIARINEAVLRLSQKWPVAVVHDKLNTKEDFVDPIHPSGAGHEKIARALVQVMVK